MTTLRELIDQHCPGMGNYGEIAAILNAPTTIDNPRAGEVDTTTTATVQPISLKEVMALVPPLEAFKIYGMSTFVADLKVAIDAGDKDYMGYMLSVAAAGDAISAQTIQALTELLQQTDEDRTVTTTTETTQPATIPGPSIAAAAGLGIVTSAQIQAAMNP